MKIFLEKALELKKKYGKVSNGLLRRKFKMNESEAAKLLNEIDKIEFELDRTDKI